MSPYRLLQEYLDEDPWKIFVCCIFCNLTKRKVAEPFFWETLRRWPTAKHLKDADYDELVNLISPLGLSKRRAKALKNMSNDYITKSWKNNPSLLFGIGKYGSDAYKIFCTNDWQNVEPKDGALIKYHNWLKLNNVHLQ